MKFLTLTLIAILTSIASFAIGPVLGSSSICLGSSSTYTDTAAGGTWSSSDGSILYIDPTGIATGLAVGAVTISYTTGTGTATLAVTVNPTPLAITGPSTVCIGTTATEVDATAGGMWSTSTSTIFTVDMFTGVVTGVTAGTATLSYVLPTGCSATRAITVTSGATAGTISGSTGICEGTSTTLTSTVSGGTWSSSTTAVATVTSSTGIVTGLLPGTTVISYTVTGGCGTATSTYTVMVFPAPAAISGPLSACAGSTVTFTDATSGGTWTSTSSGTASIGYTTGVASALTTGTTNIVYTLSTGCSVIHSFFVRVTPAAIGGPTNVCVGSTITLTDAVSGGSWSITPTTIATIGSGTGVVTGVAAGTATATYAMGSGCSVTRAITVDALPTVYTIGSSSSCGGTDITEGSSALGVSYQLYLGSTPVGSPVAGTGSAIDFGTHTTGGLYTVVATNMATGCSANMSGSVTISGNTISGDISFSSTLPDTLDMKVWLIQYDATDSSLMATDSVLTCLSGSTPHYEFTGKPAGNYMVKAKLIYGNPPGSTGYIPTYGASSIHWDSASTIVHTGGTSTQDITMIHGTVPAGPGFIGGLIVSGAGRGTTGEVPYAGMLVYLKDAATGNIITYTYSSSTGAYSFSGIAYGSYIVDPVEYHYYTTPSSVITLSASTPSVTTVNFKRRTTYGTIVPFIIITTGSNPANSTSGLSVYPNPASNYLTVQWNNQAMGNATAVITDVTGREVFKTTFEMNAASGQTQLSLPALNNGMYIMSVKSNGLSYTNRLTIEKY